MDILGNIFGSQAKVRIMRLFLFNPETMYDLKDVVGRADVNEEEAKEELKRLEKIGLLSEKHQSRMVSKTVPLRKKRGKKREVKTVFSKRKVRGWVLNERFTYLKDLQSLLVNTILLKGDDIVRRFSGVGKIKLIIVSGVFIQNTDSRLDIFIVGEKIKTKKVALVIKRMEAEIGKELQYTSLETSDFRYRLGIYDKLVRDVLDYPHEVLLDRVGVNLAFK